VLAKAKISASVLQSSV